MNMTVRSVLPEFNQLISCKDYRQLFSENVRFNVENNKIRSWSELYTLVLHEPSSASIQLAILSVNELINHPDVISNCFVHLHTIAYRNKMNCTVINSSDLGDGITTKIEHDLFSIDVHMQPSTYEPLQVYFVNELSKTACEPMLKCLQMRDYNTFEEHLKGFLVLRSAGSILCDAERILSDACKAERKSKSNYWDLFKEPLGHLLSRNGGLPPKFFYFLSPKYFIQHCLYRKESLDDALQNYGHYFILKVNIEGELIIELEPEVPSSKNVFHEFPNAIHNNIMAKASIYKSLDTNIVVKVNKPELRLYKSIQLHSINQIAHVIRLLRIQAFLYESLRDISDALVDAGDFKFADSAGNLSCLMKVTCDNDGIVDISLPPNGFTFPYVRINFDGRIVSIDDTEGDNLEHIFNKIPSILSIIYYLRSRCEHIIDDVIMEYSPINYAEDEVSLNAVFNSVIERFTTRSGTSKNNHVHDHEQIQHISPPNSVVAAVKQESIAFESKFECTPKIKIQGELIKEEKFDTIVDVTSASKIDDTHLADHLANDTLMTDLQRQQSSQPRVNNSSVSKTTQYLNQKRAAEHSINLNSNPFDLCGSSVASTVADGVKKKKGRKPKIERTALSSSNATAKPQLENKKVEPLRIKLSALTSMTTSAKQKNDRVSVQKKKVGRKRIIDDRVDKAALISNEVIQPITTMDGNCNFDISNNQNKNSSLSSFKIPRKKSQNDSNQINHLQMSINQQCASQYPVSKSLPDPIFTYGTNTLSERAQPLISTPRFSTSNRVPFQFRRLPDMNRQSVRHSAFPANVGRMQLDPRAPPTRYRFVRNQQPSSTPAPGDFRYR